MKIDNIKNEIELAFENTKEASYKEIYNFNYILDFDSEFLMKEIKPNNRGDLKERVELCLEAVKTYEKFMLNDIDTRQCVLYKTYQGNNELAACISLFQFIVRNGKLDLHVFVRSQNYDSNFDYDNQTYMTLLQYVNSFVEKTIGKIYVHVTSLHKYC
tara:strand:+ start:53 stop:526 length:474 start_codon:yes stop_codon:yes gene_type:complete